MNETDQTGANLSSVSIWKARFQKYATDTNKDEKAKPAKLDIEGLRALARIVRAIKARIEANRQDGRHADCGADPDGGASTGPVGGQDHDGNNQQKA